MTPEINRPSSTPGVDAALRAAGIPKRYAGHFPHSVPGYDGPEPPRSCCLCEDSRKLEMCRKSAQGDRFMAYMSPSLDLKEAETPLDLVRVMQSEGVSDKRQIGMIGFVLGMSYDWNQHLGRFDLGDGVFRRDKEALGKWLFPAPPPRKVGQTVEISAEEYADLRETFGLPRYRWRTRIRRFIARRFGFSQLDPTTESALNFKKEEKRDA